MFILNKKPAASVESIGTNQRSRGGDCDLYRRNRRRISWVSWIFALFLLPLTATASLASSPRFWPAVRASWGTVKTIAPGIIYSHYTVITSAGPLSIHHLRLDLPNPSVRLSSALSYDQLIGDNEPVSSMARRYGAVAAVNADYFDIGDSGMPLNIMVRDGELIRSPTGRVALAIAKSGAAHIVRYRWNGTLVLPQTRQSYWIAALNTGIVPEGLTVLSNARGYGAPAPKPRTRQAVVELARVSPPLSVSLGALQGIAPTPSGEAGGRYTVQEVWRQEPYYAPFPKNEILVVGRGGAADWLAHHVRPGMAIDLSVDTDPNWQRNATVLGGGPLLVENGRVVDQDPYNPAPGERDHPNPVAAVGISQDGRTMLLVAVDGRQPRLSIGLTQPQLAGYMRWLGAYNAMAFDSGGSVTMAVRLPGHSMPSVVNSPSDGYERAVANSLLVFSKPIPTRLGR